MKKVKFAGKILVIGCGYVSRCTLPLILKHIDIDPEKITVIDFEDNREAISSSIEAGVKFIIDKIEPDNIDIKLAGYVSSGDMVIDLAWNIDCCELLQWCHDHNVMYINTSVEVWNPYDFNKYKTPQSRTLYARHMSIRKLIASWHTKGPTMIVEHGANPGLVSHFTKQALMDIAKKIIAEKPLDPRTKSLSKFIDREDFANIASLTGTKVIHISERDMQITNRPKEVNEFVNTWSIEGLYEEGIAPAEMGWGTHEACLPKEALTHHEGPKNQICLNRCGIKTKVRSWVPAGEIVGYVIRHGEAFTISDYLTLTENGTPVYRPTVHYAYCCSDPAINSLHELEMRNFDLQENQRIMTDEIISGSDELGVLLIGHDFTSWWCGTILDIEESRKLVPHQNATTLQVAASVISAALWAIRHPMEGFNTPEELPYDEILEHAKPYLGKVISVQTDWTPFKNRKEVFYAACGGSASTTEDKEIKWQFRDFLVKD